MGTMKRMGREEFFAKLGQLSEEQVRKAMWNLYWRGSAPLRQRVESELEPLPRPRGPAQAKEEVDPGWLLYEVEEFVELARSGAYLGGDRRVTPKERTRWRFTFQRLAADASSALGDHGLDDGEFQDAAKAMETLVDLACELEGYDYFRSEDPVAAARFVVSDAVSLLWSRLRDRLGFAGFAEPAASQLVRWESPSGWTRLGPGNGVGAKEVALAYVLEKMLTVPDMWATFADGYLGALDKVAAMEKTGPQRAWRTEERAREERARRLSLWHAVLLDRLGGDEEQDRLERIAGHRALAGPEILYFRARLAQQRGDLEEARRLVSSALGVLPGHRGFLAYAAQVGAPLPKNAKL